METLERELEAAVEAWHARGWPAPKVIAVAGSGLSVDLGDPEVEPLPLDQLLPFPVHHVVGHAHTFELLRPLPDRTVLNLRGRIHSYQGYHPAEVVFPIRLAARLGAELLLMTNAAGGINPGFRPGDLVQIHDHLNLSGLNPLRGNPPESWGPRFPDMVDAYDPRLRARLRELASGLGIQLQQGIYAGLAGPSYETPAEVRMLRTLGADLAGMSTVLEVIAARHMGMRCCCLSLVTNLGAGVTGAALDHDEVLEAGRLAADDVRRLLRAALLDEDLLS